MPCQQCVTLCSHRACANCGYYYSALAQNASCIKHSRKFIPFYVTFKTRDRSVEFQVKTTKKNIFFGYNLYLQSRTESSHFSTDDENKMELQSCADTERTSGRGGRVYWRQDLPATTSVSISAMANIHQIDEQPLLDAQLQCHKPKPQMESKESLDNFLKAWVICFLKLLFVFSIEALQHDMRKLEDYLEDICCRHSQMTLAPADDDHWQVVVHAYDVHHRQFVFTMFYYSPTLQINATNLTISKRRSSHLRDVCVSNWLVGLELDRNVYVLQACPHWPHTNAYPPMRPRTHDCATHSWPCCSHASMLSCNDIMMIRSRAAAGVAALTTRTVRYLSFGFTK